MKLDRDAVLDPLVYDIVYFSPVHVGDERNTTMLYFQTDIYHRQWPTMMVDRMNAQIETLHKVEISMLPFDEQFKHQHREAVMTHCKMALAYLDQREARIAMKLCEAGDAATKSTEARILQDPDVDFDFLRVTLLSVLAVAARRVKFYQKAVEALTEAKDICVGRQGDPSKTVHPLMTALTFLNLSAVLGDIDHDEHALRWGLEALSLLYTVFSDGKTAEILEKYFLTVACHNAALLNVKLGRWEVAVELVDEGINCTKFLGEQDDNLRHQLIAVGAQAKRVPEGFLTEAYNALNGWGEDSSVWNLSFWDFSIGELKEEIHVLKHTTTLKQLIIEHFDDDRRQAGDQEDNLLAEFVLAVVSCQSLETLIVGGLEFDPRKIWRRMRKLSFLETSWYASALSFTSILESSQKPEIGQFAGLIDKLGVFAQKVVLFLVVLGNECEGVDLSSNCIDNRSLSALVKALQWRVRPKVTRPVTTLLLRSNNLDVASMQSLANAWTELPEDVGVGGSEASGQELRAVSGDEGVRNLDISLNESIGDEGLECVCLGAAKFPSFTVLRADNIGLGVPGCKAIFHLATTQLNHLSLRENRIGSEGAAIICEAALQCSTLQTLELDKCEIDAAAASHFSQLLEQHPALANLGLSHNRLASEGTAILCQGAAKSQKLASLHLAYNDITSEEAARGLALAMRECSTLVELDLSGNHFAEEGIPPIGAAIDESGLLTLMVEDMGLTETIVDEFLDHGASETQQLQVMMLSRNPIGDAGLAIIAECLSISLTDLALSGCGITGASQSMLLNLISLSPNLKSLDLSNNYLGPKGCTDMVMWMTENEKENFSLRSLEVSGCGLGDDGFCKLLPVLDALTYLGARDNGITSAGLITVMTSTQMIQLQCLDLAGNQIGEPGVHALTERFQQEHKRSLWNPKQLTSTIETVNLSNNDISSALAASTEAFLKIHNPLLTVIW
mmetsp:Transcript_30550/g.65822  ORF Transcript_30550/g.65822 Transcript_30550/m.65822 type:complete len:960 (+) Transcript_30550:76-2955(+)